MHTMSRLQPLRGFNRVDTEADPQAFVRYLDQVNGAQVSQAYKRAVLELLEAGPGHAILDVGCGTGEDVRSLARAVAPGGRVVGIDNSETMVSEARRRPSGAPCRVEFHVCDAQALPFAEATFDATRADRVFQHLKDPLRALAEMRRVTRPGGRIVVSDTDWGTMVVHPGDPEVTRRVVHFAGDAVTNGWMGRQLPALFRQAGILDVQVRAHLVAVEDYATARDLYGIERLAHAAAQKGIISASEAESWLAALRAAAEAGTFITALGGFVACGSRT